MTRPRIISIASLLALACSSTNKYSQGPVQVVEARDVRETRGNSKDIGSLGSEIHSPPVALTPPYAADFRPILIGAHLKTNVCVGVDRCDSWWDEFRNVIIPSANEELKANTSCGNDAPGVLVDVDDELVLAEPTTLNHLDIVYRSTKGQLAEHRRISPKIALAEVVSSRNHVWGLTYASTVVNLTDESAILDLQKLRPQAVHYGGTHAWSNDAGVLFFVHNGEDVDFSWLFIEHGTREPRWLVSEGGGSCGHPLATERAFLLDGNPPQVVALALDQSTPPTNISGSPLDDSYCVSATDTLIAVTGRIGSTAAVSIYDGKSWQSIAFPAADGEGEAIIDGQRIYLAFPNEPAAASDGSRLLRVGAIYALEKKNGDWVQVEKYQAPEARENGLFGMNFIVVNDAIYVTHLVDHKAPNARKNTLGDFSTCRIDF